MSKDKLKELQVEWYKKAAESGFEDIEYSDGSIQTGVPKAITKRLNSSDTTSTSTATNDYIETIRAYYRLTNVFLDEHKFINSTEKAIWEYHCNGFSCREITDCLASSNLTKYKKDTVNNIIRRLENLMKARYLRP